MNHKNTCKYERHVSFRNERHLKILNTSILDFNWIISETFKKNFFFFCIFDNFVDSIYEKRKCEDH
jgi:hypothetical protein